MMTESWLPVGDLSSLNVIIRDTVPLSQYFTVIRSPRANALLVVDRMKLQEWLEASAELCALLT